MTNLLLLLILASLLGLNTQVHEILRVMRKEDFSKEDALVKAMTEQDVETSSKLETAISELPPQPTEGKT